MEKNLKRIYVYIHIYILYMSIRASLVSLRLRNLPAMQETQVQSLCREDRLEEEMATHSTILAWKIPWTEEPGGLCSSSKRVRHTEHMSINSLQEFLES